MRRARDVEPVRGARGFRPVNCTDRRLAATFASPSDDLCRSALACLRASAVIARSMRLKTYDIEVHRLKSLRHDKGRIEIGIDALVLPRPAHDEEPCA